MFKPFFLLQHPYNNMENFFILTTIIALPKALAHGNTIDFFC